MALPSLALHCIASHRIGLCCAALRRATSRRWRPSYCLETIHKPSNRLPAWRLPIGLFRIVGHADSCSVSGGLFCSLASPRYLPFLHLSVSQSVSRSLAYLCACSLTCSLVGCVARLARLTHVAQSHKPVHDFPLNSLGRFDLESITRLLFFRSPACSLARGAQMQRKSVRQQVKRRQRDAQPTRLAGEYNVFFPTQTSSLSVCPFSSTSAPTLAATVAAEEATPKRSRFLLAIPRFVAVNGVAVAVAVVLVSPLVVYLLRLPSTYQSVREWKRKAGDQLSSLYSAAAAAAAASQFRLPPPNQVHLTCLAAQSSAQRDHSQRYTATSERRLITIATDLGAATATIGTIVASKGQQQPWSMKQL